MYPEEQGILGQVKTLGPLTRALATAGIAQMPIPGDQRMAFADGGGIGGITRPQTADELMARMTAKYGAPSAGTAQQPAPQVQQPAQPKPAPAQPTGSGQGILGILRGRKEAIDKAAGFANGGKISGPGTPTSDSIPAKIRETGEGILVSNRERIVSADQEKALQQVAQAQGFESVDSMLERMTGKPVGPTIKSTARAAADGLSPDTDPDTDGRRQYSPNYGDAFAYRGGSFAPQGPSNGPDSNQLTPEIPGITTRTSSAPDSLQGIAAPLGSLAVAKQEVRQVSGEHAPSRNPASAGIAALPVGRNEQGVITAESAQGILAAPMQRSGGIAGSYDGKGVNEIMARENKARGEMIDLMIKANGGNGIGIVGETASNGSREVNPISDALTIERAHGQQLRNEQRQRLNQLQGQIVAEADPNKRQEIAGQIRALGGRIDQPRQSGQLTLPQRRSNFEIDAARERIAGLSADEIKRKTANFTATGRENPDFDPTLAKAVSLANRRKYGDDADFDQRQQQEQQPAGTDGDVMTRFRADAGMKGHTMGKQTDLGVEVLDASGKLIGHYR